jgi:hypothetical protein
MKRFTVSFFARALALIIVVSFGLGATACSELTSPTGAGPVTYQDKIVTPASTTSDSLSQALLFETYEVSPNFKGVIGYAPLINSYYLVADGASLSIGNIPTNRTTLDAIIADSSAYLGEGPLPPTTLLSGKIDFMIGMTTVLKTIRIRVDFDANRKVTNISVPSVVLDISTSGLRDPLASTTASMQAPASGSLSVSSTSAPLSRSYTFTTEQLKKYPWLATASSKKVLSTQGNQY